LLVEHPEIRALERAAEHPITISSVAVRSAGKDLRSSDISRRPEILSFLSDYEMSKFSYGNGR